MSCRLCRRMRNCRPAGRRCEREDVLPSRQRRHHPGPRHPALRPGPALRRACPAGHVRAGLFRHAPAGLHGADALERRQPRDRLWQGLPGRVHGGPALQHRGYRSTAPRSSRFPACLTIRSRWPSGSSIASRSSTGSRAAGAAAVSCKKIRDGVILSLSKDRTPARRSGGGRHPARGAARKGPAGQCLILRLRCASLRMTSLSSRRPGFSHTRESRALRREAITASAAANSPPSSRRSSETRRCNRRGR